MTVPAVHHWYAGDMWNATRMNEITNQINWMQNPPMVHLRRRTTTQSIPSAAWTKVSFDTVVNSYDPYDMYDSATDPTMVVFTEPGWYSCEIYSSWVNWGATDGCVVMGLMKNNFGPTPGSNGTLLRSDRRTQPSQGTNIVMRAEATFFFNVGDFVFMGAYNSDTGSAHSLANTSDAECSGLRIRWVSN
jgi:hypothetical protein